MALLHGQGGSIVAQCFQSFGRAFVEASFVTSVILLLIALPAILLLSRPARPVGAWLSSLLALSLATIAVERLYLILYSELFHLPQYALLGLLLGLAWGPNPRLLLFGALLGMGDEALQLLMLYLDEPSGHFDWNDVILDLCGFALGLLASELFNTTTRAPADHNLTGSTLPALALALWLYAIGAELYAGPSSMEFWTVWSFDARQRRFHELNFYFGMATSVACLPLLLAILAWDQPRGRSLRFTLFLLLSAIPTALAWQLAAPPESPPLPTLWLIKASSPPSIDGALDEDLWRRAQAALIETNRRGETQGPTSRVFAAWDETALYFAFECPDDDIWTRRRAHDDPHLPEDELVELFLLLHAQGEQHRYIELEISPEGQTFELMIQHDGRDFSGDPSWNAPGLRLSTKIEGRLRNFDEAPGGGQRWSAELAIPWSALPELRPEAGQTLRANFFRVERPANSAPALLCWSTTKDSSFHKPARFGRLRLSARSGKMRPQR